MKFICKMALPDHQEMGLRGVVVEGCVEPFTHSLL